VGGVQGHSGRKTIRAIGSWNSVVGKYSYDALDRLNNLVQACHAPDGGGSGSGIMKGVVKRSVRGLRRRARGT